MPRNSFIALTAVSPTEESIGDNFYTLEAELNSVEDKNEESCEEGSCPNKSMEEIAILELMKNGKFYRIKAVDLETGKEALTSVHPCSIRKSNFR